MQEILQQFAGGDMGNTGMSSEQMYGHLDRMIGQAPNEHVHGAIGDALQQLGPNGFGQSVAQAAQGMGPQEKQGLMGLLGQAVENGGGTLPGVLSSLGLGGGGAQASGASPSGSAQGQGGNISAEALGSLASYALRNHGGALSSVLGNQANNNGSGVLSLLGNPTVQRVGMNLAQRLLSHEGL